MEEAINSDAFGNKPQSAKHSSVIYKRGNSTGAGYAEKLAQINRAVCALMAELPEAQRDIITLWYYDGLCMKEINEKLNLTESIFYELFSKARESMHETLEEMHRSGVLLGRLYALTTFPVLTCLLFMDESTNFRPGESGIALENFRQIAGNKGKSQNCFANTPHLKIEADRHK